MIRDRWYAVLDSSEIKRGKPVGVRRLSERLVFWRDGSGKIACLRDTCPHRGAALSAGKLRGDHVECPFHGLRFDRAGRCKLIPANGINTPVPDRFDTRAYPVREAHGLIWLWWGEPRDELPPLPFFEDIDGTFAHATFIDRWPVHYSRAVENQLDVVHLPFVHRTTIGRGNRTLVDGPITTLSDGLLNIWVYNRVDDGTPPLKPDEIPEPAHLPLIWFRFPNIWQNRLSDDVRIFLAFAPVDEENTVIYMRFYQRAIRLPVLRGLYAVLGMLSSIIILRQDKRVVVTQRPKKTAARMGEQLIQGDRPIVLYRMHRQELIEKGGE